jgi:hypothetical protein
VGCNPMAHPGLQVWGTFADEVRPKGHSWRVDFTGYLPPAGADFVGGHPPQSIG